MSSQAPRSIRDTIAVALILIVMHGAFGAFLGAVAGAVIGGVTGGMMGFLLSLLPPYCTLTMMFYNIFATGLLGAMLFSVVFAAAGAFIALGVFAFRGDTSDEK